MKEFKKNNQKKFWHFPIFLVLFFLVFVIFAYNVIALVPKKRETSNTKNLILDEIQELKKRESNLKKNIENLETEKGTEEIIRNKYQVVKEGEKMVVIVDEDNSELEIVREKSNHSFWTWFIRLFE